MIIWAESELEELYALLDLDTVDSDSDPFAQSEHDIEDRQEVQFPVLAEEEEE
jgi:hypothetical protein